MVCSDNVIRAGLTPKLRDVDTLCEMLTYKMKSPALLIPEKIDEFTLRYAPGVPEFCFTLTQIPENRSPCKYSLDCVKSVSIVLVTKGEASAVSTKNGGKPDQIDISSGFVMLLQPSETLHLSVKPGGLTLARCFTPNP